MRENVVHVRRHYIQETETRARLCSVQRSFLAAAAADEMQRTRHEEVARYHRWQIVNSSSAPWECRQPAAGGREQTTMTQPVPVVRRCQLYPVISASRVWVSGASHQLWSIVDTFNWSSVWREKLQPMRWSRADFAENDTRWGSEGMRGDCPGSTCGDGLNKLNARLPPRSILVESKPRQQLDLRASSATAHTARISVCRHYANCCQVLP